ncbi:hypothetical protein [Achromobacter insuavis]|uniref:hypothetical protein n=1 Tax=Achromobacter insuavis TaxID=1287735 RepID=UPI0029D6F204|nr:hypothetical protein [Achromobacter sp.]MCG2601548.1 hypothetical protein [Achromobacter sp.]
MTNHNNAAQAANENPLGDEYVNEIIQRHGYDSPESVIARLHQWIGLHSDEDTVTLLMYEAHKALSKLRAPVADERAALRRALEGMLAVFACGAPQGESPTIDAARAALASAPVAGEAVYTLRVRGAIQAWTPTAAAFSIPDGEHQLFLCPAAPQPSAEPARILFPSHLRKMWSGGEVQAWLDQHQGVTPPPATAKGSLARYRQWKAEQDQAAAPCTCPSGDGSLHHPCPAHPRTNEGRA